MEDYFGAEEYQPPQSTYLPPQQEDDAFDFAPAPATTLSTPLHMQPPHNRNNSSTSPTTPPPSPPPYPSPKARTASMTSKRTRPPVASGRRRNASKTPSVRRA